MLKMSIFKLFSGVVVLLIAIFIVIVSAQTTDVNKSEMIVVDTDAGTDDAMALSLLLQAERQLGERGSKIIAVTAVHGNTKTDNVCLNVLKVLKLSDRLDIPVYKGAHGSLMDTPEITDYFGIDGLGDVPFPLDEPDQSLLQKEHAVHALVDLVNRYPDEIVLLALGPLTNVALAINLDKKFLKKLKKLIILGGSTEGRGNVNPGVEFNFHMDPEANFVVFNRDYTNNTIDLISWENIERVEITMDWRINVLGAINSTIIQILNEAEHLDKQDQDGLWMFADPIAAVVTIHPDIAKESKNLHVIALTQGAARGGLLVDHYNNKKEIERKVNILGGIDANKHKELLLKYFS